MNVDQWMKEKNIAAYGPHLEPIIRLAFAAGADQQRYEELRSFLMSPPKFDLIPFLKAFEAWSLATFGPGKRTSAVLAHIRKELLEVEREPDQIDEWCDVLLLAFTGALRRGFTPQGICDGLVDKFTVNQERKWPPPGAEGDVIEHIKPLIPGTPEWMQSMYEKNWGAQARMLQIKAVDRLAFEDRKYLPPHPHPQDFKWVEDLAADQRAQAGLPEPETPPLPPHLHPEDWGNFDLAAEPPPFTRPTWDHGCEACGPNMPCVHREPGQAEEFKRG